MIRGTVRKLNSLHGDIIIIQTRAGIPKNRLYTQTFDNKIFSFAVQNKMIDRSSRRNGKKRPTKVENERER